MEIVQEFLAYAGEFEKTLKDDDWSRLRRFFNDDAVYEVKAPSFGCHLVGREAIFAGMKKSLDGFDRKFDGRDAQVTSGPEIEGDELRFGWEVRYKSATLPGFVLRGRSLARYRDGKIAYLSDLYEPGVQGEIDAWQRQSGVKLDASYT